MVFPSEFSSEAMLVPLPSSVSREGADLVLPAAPRIAGPQAETLAAILSERAGLTPRIVDEAEGADIVLGVAENGAPEGYAIVVSDCVRVTGNDEAGLFYALQTLRQLLRREAEGWAFPGLRISDAPRFGYRGVMLDVARRFFPVPEVKAFIDRAASLKFNRLHLHLTDDQGWRLEIASHPLLTEKAATTGALGRPGGFYTASDYAEIVSYAAARHLVVVPEIDLPGHTHAVGVAYPELVEDPVIGKELRAQSEELAQPLPRTGVPYEGWGVGHSSLRIHSAETDAFLRDALGEVARLTPGPYLHIGGDEALGTPAADFADFIERVTALVFSLGKTPLAWHEAGAADVAPGTIGQFWGSIVPQGDHAAQLRRFANNGGGVILSPSDTAYLDQKYDADFPLGLSWAAFIDLETAYGWEPTAIVPEIPEGAILGVEAPLWTETVSSLADADALFFPRAAAIAEIGWSPAARRSWSSFARRIGATRGVWDAAGWGGNRSAEPEGGIA